MSGTTTSTVTSDRRLRPGILKTLMRFEHLSGVGADHQLILANATQITLNQITQQLSLAALIEAHPPLQGLPFPPK